MTMETRLNQKLLGELAQLGRDHLPDGRMRPARLLEAARRVGELPRLWSQFVNFDPARRQYTRLHRGEDVEIWLLCWDFGQDTLLHDHGGSGGAFTVVTGALLEDRGMIGRPGLRTRRHDAGHGASFSPRYVHNLVAADAGPAVSIHAYSPPLTSMNFYCVLRDGLHHLRRVLTDSPEPDASDVVEQAVRLAATRS